MPTVYRAGLWYHYPSTVPLQWGMAGDVPLAGDYLGTSAAQLAVFRPSSGIWFVEGMNPVQWGLTGDMPVPADYDGDGRLDIAIWRPSTGLWAILCSSGRAAIYQTWGLAGDIPVPADYDGDGRADFAVFRPSTGIWYIFMQAGYTSRQSIPEGTTPFVLTAAFGDSTSVPVPADYDGDGIADIATWTPGTSMWSVRNGFSIMVGQPGDIPVVTVNR
jgi:FG-GAP-like repeat